MFRVGISVEGQTEAEFVEQILQPHLSKFQVSAVATIIVTKRVVNGPNHAGGSLSLGRVEPQIRRLLPSFDLVTTFYDYYGFRDREDGETADGLAGRMARTLDQPRNFRPYIQSYEFEALLFAAPDAIGPLVGGAHAVAELKDIVRQCGEPEAIDDGQETCPSARLDGLFNRHMKRGYRKIRDGNRLADSIGIASMRNACPRFGEWLGLMERHGRASEADRLSMSSMPVC